MVDALCFNLFNCGMEALFHNEIIEFFDESVMPFRRCVVAGSGLSSSIAALPLPENRLRRLKKRLRFMRIVRSVGGSLVFPSSNESLTM